MALSACRGEAGESLQSTIQRDKAVVRETVNDDYCDASGQRVDLVRVGEMGGVQVFVARGSYYRPITNSLAGVLIQRYGLADIQHPKELLGEKRDVLARFIHVAQPLVGVYGLPAGSVHIFWDTAGGTIAFNRNGSVFLNGRYFEAWRKYFLFFLCPSRRFDTDDELFYAPQTTRRSRRARWRRRTSRGISHSRMRSRTTSSGRTMQSTSFGSVASANDLCTA